MSTVISATTPRAQVAACTGPAPPGSCPTHTTLMVMRCASTPSSITPRRSPARSGASTEPPASAGPDRAWSGPRHPADSCWECGYPATVRGDLAVSAYAPVASPYGRPAAPTALVTRSVASAVAGGRGLTRRLGGVAPSLSGARPRPRAVTSRGSPSGHLAAVTVAGQLAAVTSGASTSTAAPTPNGHLPCRSRGADSGELAVDRGGSPQSLFSGWSARSGRLDPGRRAVSSVGPGRQG
jgi:hypothetical protein